MENTGVERQWSDWLHWKAFLAGKPSVTYRTPCCMNFNFGFSQSTIRGAFQSAKSSGLHIRKVVNGKMFQTIYGKIIFKFPEIDHQEFLFHLFWYFSWNFWKFSVESSLLANSITSVFSKNVSIEFQYHLSLCQKRVFLWHNYYQNVFHLWGHFHANPFS